MLQDTQIVTGTTQEKSLIVNGLVISDFDTVGYNHCKMIELEMI